MLHKFRKYFNKKKEIQKKPIHIIDVFAELHVIVRNLTKEELLDIFMPSAIEYIDDRALEVEYTKLYYDNRCTYWVSYHYLGLRILDIALKNNPEFINHALPGTQTHYFEYKNLNKLLTIYFETISKRLDVTLIENTAKEIDNMYNNMYNNMRNIYVPSLDLVCKGFFVPLPDNLVNKHLIETINFTPVYISKKRFDFRINYTNSCMLKNRIDKKRAMMREESFGYIKTN